MLVTVPFSDFSPIGVTKIFENIKLVVEIVEDDDFISVRFKFADELRKIAEYIEINTTTDPAVAG